ncbi:hypothetical protein HDV06_004446 [Boothiomyces sp. JEL0866]|nr:hypothetical protein HDV06_004446 [Boothiomyces sp. JEL0866]
MYTENKDKKGFDYILKSMAAGGIAGSAAKTVVAPLDRVKILFQTSQPAYEKYQGSIIGYFRALNDIQLSQGSVALFRGHSATLLRIFPYSGIKFMAYEQCKRVLIPTKEYNTGLRNFIAGSIAGCIASAISYPFDLIRVRLAFEVKSNPLSISEICKIIYSEPNHLVAAKGTILNFYRGLTVSLVGMIPYAGASFYTYEMLKKRAMDIAICRNDNPPPALNWWSTVTIGAVSGLMAQTSSYPFEVIRRHIQVSTINDSSKQSSFFGTAKGIFKRKGFRGFWVGLGIGYLKVTPMFAVSFYTYEYCKLLFNIA